MGDEATQELRIDSGQFKTLLGVRTAVGELDEKTSDIDLRLREIEASKKPLEGWQKLRVGMLAGALLLVWGGFVWLGKDRINTVEGRIETLEMWKIEASGVLVTNRYRATDGIISALCDGQMAQAVSQHLRDHEGAHSLEAFPTRPGLRDQGEDCREAAHRMIEDLRHRVSAGG